MSFNTWVRQIHRWLSVIFTLAVLANIVAMMMKHQALWIGLCALFPLIAMLITGLYMFALPYFWKGGARA